MKTYIHFRTPELALTCAEYAEKTLGWDRNSNLRTENQFTNSRFSEPDGGITVSFNDETKLITWEGENYRKHVTVEIYCINDFRKFDPAKPILVDGYVVEFSDTEIKVGCARVPNETVKAVYERITKAN